MNKNRRDHQHSRPWNRFCNMNLEVLENRRLLAVDFGDAPDPAAGTGSGNYQTMLVDGGPQHTIVPGLRIGASVDGDSGALQNTAANADDVDGALPDDENGVVSPASDLVLTVGTQPRMAVRVTNTTGADATLYGWIDYNANGVFENGSERTSVPVPDGTDNGVVALTFPTIPLSTPAGATYARLRLSTDGAAAVSTGAASDGEVEDYRVRITKPGDGTVNQTLKIAHHTNGGPTLANQDYFGGSVTALGDLDGDGVVDLAVGAPSDDTGGADRGAVYVLFMNADGTVRNSVKIAHQTNGGPVLQQPHYFGYSLASLGDLDGDGVSELAVGAIRDSASGFLRGAVFVLFMNTDGTVRESRRIAHDVNGGPMLADLDMFGFSVGALGDLDADGVPDLAVGAYFDSTGGNSRGAVHVLFMNTDGTVKNTLKIAHQTNGGPTLADLDNFGASVTALGDLDGDGVTDLAVGALQNGTSGENHGAVYVLFMNSNGSVKDTVKIAHQTNGGPVLANRDGFGASLTSLGDLDGDHVTDLAVGAMWDDTGGNDLGAAYVLFMNANGTVKEFVKIANQLNGGPALANGDNFGRSLTTVGDLNGDGAIELAVGAHLDNTGNVDAGAIHVLFMKPKAMSLPGDFNDDGFYDVTDLDALVAAIADANHPSAFDLTGDNLVDLDDRDAWLALAGNVNLGSGRAYLVGDANLDGAVDGSDFNLWNSNKFTSVAAWSHGDFNADGVVDGSDFNLWNSNKFQASDALPWIKELPSLSRRGVTTRDGTRPPSLRAHDSDRNDYFARFWHRQEILTQSLCIAETMRSELIESIARGQ